VGEQMAVILLFVMFGLYYPKYGGRGAGDG
jgi:hypothetical protein